MQLAVVAAGFTPGEADRLRRAMAAWRRRGGLGSFEARLVEGMRARNYSEAFARQIFQQICGFGEYGFPESHAASFALLVYVSAWLKLHAPAVFTAALLNSQPMGFYGPAQLVQSARRQGVEIRPVDVNRSDWECTLEPVVGQACDPPAGGRLDGRYALRLGLRMVSGLAREAGEGLVRSRTTVYRSVQDLSGRARLSAADLGALAAAGALADVAGHRYRARWAVAGVEGALPVFPVPHVAEGIPLLRSPTEAEDIAGDYQSLGLTLGRHPLALLRARLGRLGCLPAEALQDLADHDRVQAAGIVTTRQRPGSAAGVTFVTLEDETGSVNVIVWPRLAERQRQILLEARLLGVRGELQRQGDVLHLVAARLTDHTALLGDLLTRSRDFS